MVYRVFGGIAFILLGLEAFGVLSLGVLTGVALLVAGVALIAGQ